MDQIFLESFDSTVGHNQKTIEVELGSGTFKF